MPGPSYRPFVGALGVTLLMLGLVFGGWLLAVGVHRADRDPVRLAHRRRQGIPQDRRGGPDRPPREHPARPRTPSLLISAPWPSCSSAGSSCRPASCRRGPPRPGPPGRPVRRPGSAAPAPPAASSAPLPAGDVTITAQGFAFDRRDRRRAPPTRRSRSCSTTRRRARPTTSTCRMPPAPSSSTASPSWASRTSSTTSGALPAGTYTFVCSLHPTLMTGTATLK